ncbi:MAG: DinB family protein [Candidatus Nanopelagicales bacterium]
MTGEQQTQPEPDDKDWTWVLVRRCDECGFAAGEVPRHDLVSLAAEVGRRWDATWAAAADADPTRRPRPAVWSPLEYACHVRDVYDLAVFRTALMREQDDPVFANWDQDATALESDYGSTDPAALAPALASSARAYERALATVRDEEWSRPGRRSNGSVFTVDSFTRYVLHDLAHHLTDVTGARWS